MKYRCWFASGDARIGFDARICREHACGSPGLNDVTRVGWGLPRVAEMWEPA